MTIDNEVERDCVEVGLFSVDENWKYTPDTDWNNARRGWLTRSRIDSLMQCIEDSKPSGDPVILQLFDTDEVMRLEFINDNGAYKCNRYADDEPNQESTTDWTESVKWRNDFVKANKQRVTPAPNSEFNLYGFMRPTEQEITPALAQWVSDAKTGDESKETKTKMESEVKIIPQPINESRLGLNISLFLMVNIPTIICLIFAVLFIGKGDEWGIRIQDKWLSATGLGVLFLLGAAYSLYQGMAEFWKLMALKNAEDN
jgi:hypothetical protein